MQRRSPPTEVGNMDGVRVAGVLLQAGAQDSPSLLEWGDGRHGGTPSNPGSAFGLASWGWPPGAGLLGWPPGGLCHGPGHWARSWGAFMLGLRRGLWDWGFGIGPRPRGLGALALASSFAPGSGSWPRPITPAWLGAVPVQASCTTSSRASAAPRTPRSRRCAQRS